MSQLFIHITNHVLRCSKRASSTLCPHPILRNGGIGGLLQANASLKSAFLQTSKKASKLTLLHPENNPVLQNIKRLYAKKAGRPSFEVNSNVAQDVVVFTYSDARFFRMLTVFGIVQFFFWGNIAMFAYSGMKGLETRPVEDQSSWLNMISSFQTKHKYRIAVACVALGYVVLFFTWIYPLRTITKLILEKGGHMVRITTYTHFGRTKDFVVPLNDISCTQSRLAKGVQVSLKIRGKWFYYLMDKRDGKFLDPQVFDYVIGLNRSLK